MDVPNVRRTEYQLVSYIFRGKKERWLYARLNGYFSGQY